MASILLIGNYGQKNIGDEAILRCMVSPNDIYLVPSRDKGFKEIYHPHVEDKIIPIKIAPLSIIKAVFNSDKIIIGGGGIWSGYTGPLAKMLPLFASVCSIFRKKVEYKYVGVYSTAPLAERMLVNLSMLLAKKVSIRDISSKKQLWEINKKKAVVTSDAVIEKQDKIFASALRYEESNILEFGHLKDAIGISIKPTKNPEVNDKIVKVFRELIEKHKRRTFVIFPFSHTDSRIEDDLSMARRITAKNTIIISHGDPAKWLGIIKDHMKCFIGMRLHSLIFSYLTGTRCLAIPYEEKCIEFAKISEMNICMPESISYKDLEVFIR